MNEAPELIPDIVLAPLVAFDDSGHRLGYGGGYYDRTLAALRMESKARTGPHDAKGPVVIGCAYAGQRVAHIPALETDERLDWILTEQGARRFHGS